MCHLLLYKDIHAHIFEGKEIVKVSLLLSLVYESYSLMSTNLIYIQLIKWIENLLFLAIISHSENAYQQTKSSYCFFFFWFSLFLKGKSIQTVYLLFHSPWHDFVFPAFLSFLFINCVQRSHPQLLPNCLHADDIISPKTRILLVVRALDCITSCTWCHPSSVALHCDSVPTAAQYSQHDVLQLIHFTPFSQMPASILLSFSWTLLPHADDSLLFPNIINLVSSILLAFSVSSSCNQESECLSVCFSRFYKVIKLQ